MKLTAEDISFRYDNGNRRILNRISLEIDAGERVGLLAPSGFGKTTFCKILAGYERPTEGRVLLDQMPLETFRGKLPVQMIWQHPEQSVNPKWKMKRVLAEGMPMDEALIGKLGIRQDWMERYPAELSGGELQRFCIARALGYGTGILLADEITAMLDLITQSEIWKILIEETRRREIGMLIVSHSESLVNAVCSRRIELSAETD